MIAHGFFQFNVPNWSFHSKYYSGIWINVMCKVNFLVVINLAGTQSELSLYVCLIRIVDHNSDKLTQQFIPGQLINLNSIRMKKTWTEIYPCLLCRTRMEWKPLTCRNHITVYLCSSPTGSFLVCGHY